MPKRGTFVPIPQRAAGQSGNPDRAQGALVLSHLHGRTVTDGLLRR